MQDWKKIIYSLFLVVICITILALHIFDNHSLIAIIGCLTVIMFNYFLRALLPLKKAHVELISWIIFICGFGIIYFFDQTLFNKNFFINSALFIFFYALLLLILKSQINDPDSLTYGDEPFHKTYFEGQVRKVKEKCAQWKKSIKRWMGKD